MKTLFQMRNDYQRFKITRNLACTFLCMKIIRLKTDCILLMSPNRQNSELRSNSMLQVSPYLPSILHLCAALWLSILVFGYGSLRCFQTNVVTFRSEIPRTGRCCRGWHGRRPCTVRMTLNKHKKWFHSSRMKFPLVQMSASWFLESTYLFESCGRKWFCRIASQEQLCGSWKHVTLSGFFLFMVILITASLSLKMYNFFCAKYSHLKGQNRHWTNQDVFENWKKVWVMNFFWLLYRATRLTVLACLSVLIWVWVHYINNEIPKIKRGNTVHSWTCIKRNNFRLS